MPTVSEEDWKKISKLVDNFYNRADTEPFRAPVPWKEMGLVDYPQIIKHPMDLGTIKKKLEKREYVTAQQVTADVRLVWTNCMTYNADGSDFYKLADSLKRKWDERWSKLDINSSSNAAAAGEDDAKGVAGGSSNAKATVQDKRKFAKSLYEISKEDLGKILVDVEAKCPSAIKRNASEDELEFNIDELTSELLQELTKFVESVKKRKKAPPNKKKST